jgi:hypothetical protein
MKAFFAIIIFTSISISHSFCQAEYYITEYNIQVYFDGDLVDNDTVKYFHDDQERITRTETLSGYSIYSYEGNTITKDEFSLSDELESRKVEIQNEDGFRLVYSAYSTYGNDLELYAVDSITRNNDNQIVKYISYYDNGYGFEKESEENIIYNSNGDVMSENRLLFYNGELNFIVSRFNTYNSENFIETTVRKTEELFNNTSYSDTTNYFFDGEDLIRTELKDYTSYGFNKCSQNEYEYDGDLRTATRSSSSFLDCSNYIEDRRIERLSNENILFGLESSLTFEPNENNIFEKTSSLNYIQEGILGDNEILLNRIQISFDGELESFKFINDSKYKKSEIVSSKNLLLVNEMVIFPNITTQKSLVNYKIEDVEFDNIRIVDFTGQTVVHEPVINKRNKYFTAPSTTGMYFVQLFKGRVPVNKATKLIVK